MNNSMRAAAVGIMLAGAGCPGEGAGVQNLTPDKVETTENPVVEGVEATRAGALSTWQQDKECRELGGVEVCTGAVHGIIEEL